MTGAWNGAGNPTRADCIRLAAECADQAVEAADTALASIARVYAETAKAWAAIAAVAEEAQETDPPGCAPLRTGKCGHSTTVWRSVDHWLHVDLSRCDRPPTN
jgi:hypothetical protein